MPTLQTKAPPTAGIEGNAWNPEPEQVREIDSALDLAEETGLPFITCQKLEKIASEHPPNSNSGTVALVWVRRWVAEDFQQEMDPVLPDRWMVVHDFRDAGGKAWTCRDAYWIDSWTMLCNDIFPVEVDMDEVGHPVDVTHHGFADGEGVCWPPKKDSVAFVFR